MNRCPLHRISPTPARERSSHGKQQRAGRAGPVGALAFRGGGTFWLRRRRQGSCGLSSSGSPGGTGITRPARGRCASRCPRSSAGTTRRGRRIAIRSRHATSPCDHIHSSSPIVPGAVLAGPARSGRQAASCELRCAIRRRLLETWPCVSCTRLGRSFPWFTCYGYRNVSRRSSMSVPPVESGIRALLHSE